MNDLARVVAPMAAARRQRGVTLIEFMVAVVIGMLMVAALATLIANQSASRGEIDRSGKMLENGRYALSALAKDVEMAGYWGEYAQAPTVPPVAAPEHLFNGKVLDPCSLAAADLAQAMGVPVQGYDYTSTEFPTCISNRKTGTDVLVVRRLDPDMSTIVDGSGNVDLSKLVDGQIYVQTGMNSLGTAVAVYPGEASTTAANTLLFTGKKKDKTTVANTRRYVVHIYYVSECSVEVDNSCAGADGGTPIPTLKRVELSVSSGAPAWKTTTIAEGIEDLQVDYGVDSDSDGVPNVDSDGLGHTPQDWANVMSLKIYLLGRTTEKTPGFSDDKTYALGSKPAASAAADGYKRHVFVQSVRLVNPAGRLKV